VPLLSPGDQIDIWVVERQLGSGGMGSVYRCHNRSAARILAAVKVLDPSLARHKQANQRFVREADILGSLDHKHIVRVRNVRDDHDPPYIEMEFVQGESLEDRLARGPLRLDRAITIMVQAAEALTYMHARSVRHRDIKPANFVMRDDSTLVLVDFGLAVDADNSRLTQNNVTFGTVSYAPPEWVTPEEIDEEKWDIYSLGVVFYEVLTGELAFPTSGRGTARQQAMQVIVNKQAHKPLDPGSHLPVSVRQLVAYMTQADRKKRIASMADVLERMKDLVIDDAAIVRGGKPVPRIAPLATWAGSHDPPAGRPLAEGPTIRMEEDVAPKRTTLPSLGGAAAAVATMGVLGVVGGVVLLSLLAAFLFWPPGPSTVELRVGPLPEGLPVEVTLGGASRTAKAGDLLRFEVLESGAHDLSWVVGDNCGDCPEACEAWCTSGTRRLHVEAGALVSERLGATPPLPSPFSLRLPGLLESEKPPVATLGGRALERHGDTWTRTAAKPGEHELLVELGTCAAEDKGCFPDCPVGCTSYRATVVIGADEAPVSLDVGLSASDPAEEEAGVVEADPRPMETARPPVPEPVAASGAGARVSNGAFAAWVETRPEWGRGRPAASHADANYLVHWSGERPGQGQENASVVNISWHAANAFCLGHGGLAAADAEPQSWVEGGGPAYEWRIAGNTAAWVGAAGDRSNGANFKLNFTSPLNTFRCER
jgi:hypothetical protein